MAWKWSQGVRGMLSRAFVPQLNEQLRLERTQGSRALWGDLILSSGGGARRILGKGPSM